MLARPIGQALRRFRRTNGMKQEHLAELLNVSQGTVSRWESGAHEPEIAQRHRILDIVAAHADNDSDLAIRRLVEQSSAAVHLVCDASHKLLAASPSRQASWPLGAHSYLGQSLWPFASPRIIEVEQGLESAGWFERPFQILEFLTDPNGRPEMPVNASMVRWETIALSDGRTGRLTTTLTSYA